MLIVYNKLAIKKKEAILGAYILSSVVLLLAKRERRTYHRLTYRYRSVYRTHLASTAPALFLLPTNHMATYELPCTYDL